MKEECQKALHRAYLFIDGEVLSEVEREDVQSHLEACRPCYERFGLDQEVAALVSRLGSCQRCPEEVRIRITALFYRG